MEIWEFVIKIAFGLGILFGLPLAAKKLYKEFRREYRIVDGFLVPFITPKIRDLAFFVPTIEIRKYYEGLIHIHKAWLLFRDNNGEVYLYEANHKYIKPNEISNTGNVEFGNFFLPPQFYNTILNSNVYFCIEDGKGKQSYFCLNRIDTSRLCNFLSYQLMNRKRYITQFLVGTQETKNEEGKIIEKKPIIWWAKAKRGQKLGGKVIIEK
ncbi:MAG: hypothetical protein JW984_05535 [Deltaproteobacteria bacterium]|uniref:Uncharacterized protein n=1 Tax=Candidatus Zymogenus saltonus TaxID=2844893 RepID=A0A9D8PMX9_9DELT|nr:hypothetical protein [Candidatus Zymogenus saltonus]